MKWPNTFDSRLESWNRLRDHCLAESVESALSQINAWWFRSPWQPYYLHWDDSTTWPDPWQLLSDNIFCEVARGLGILYTICLLERADLAVVRLVLTQSGHNLVLVNDSKYILNWDPDSVVNTFQEVKILRQFQNYPIV